MDLEPIFTQLVNEVLVPIVTTAVNDAIANQQTTTPSGDFIKVPEACKILRCSEPTFYDHVRKGQIKIIKNGCSSLVDRQRLLEDLDSGKLKFRKDKHRRN